MGVISLFCILVLLAPACVAQRRSLSPETQRVAAIIGVDPVIDRLEALRQQPASPDRTLQLLLARQEITEAVISASLDVDAAIADIQLEQAEVREAMQQLGGRRDRAVAVTNLAGIILGGGIGVLGNARQLNNSTAQAGNAVGVGSGTASTLLSLVGVRLQRGGKVPVTISPKMLAPILRPGAAPADVYPPEVWRYLNSAPEGGAPTPAQALVENWTKQSRITQDQSAAATRKIDYLTSSYARNVPLSINDLSDREAMLSDLRARVALMKTNLSELMIYLRTAGI